MGLLSNLFKQQVKEEKVNTNEKLNKIENDSLSILKKPDYTKEIDTILLILENLKLLDEKLILKDISKNKNIDTSILYRLRINPYENLEFLKRYLQSNELGYGKDKLISVEERLHNIIKEGHLNNKNKSEITEEMISYAKTEILEYEKILSNFNRIISTLIYNKDLKESERLVMLDYWTNYFKEEELGYSIDLDKKVNDMITALKKLEYGGYGDEEISKFEKSSHELINKLRDTKSTCEIYKEIENNLYMPLMSKYLKKLNILKEQIIKIDLNDDLKESEKEKQIVSLIIDFKEENAHKINLNLITENMKRNLITLKYGGYGEEAINEFNSHISDLILTGKERSKKDKEVYIEIQLIYNSYLKKYNKKLEVLEKQLEEIKNDNTLSIKEKEILKQDKLQSFRDETGHRININSRFESMLNNLKNLDNGTLTEEDLNNFKSQYEEILNTSKSTKVIMERLEFIYNVMLKGEKPLQSNNKSLDIDTLIDSLVTKLSNLEGGGYKETVIKDFKKKCQTIKKKSLSKEEQEKQINLEAKYLEDTYLYNLDIYTKWANKKIYSYLGEDKDKYIATINDQVKYMLSLSEKEKINYFNEDSNSKKEAMEKYNLKVKVKFLAEQEQLTSKKELVEERLKELENGNIPYSKEELEKVDSNINFNYPLITIDEYINSTLYSEILSIEANNH